MKQAFLITAYKNMNHLIKMVDFLSDNGFLFFVHIDKKSKVSKSDINNLLQKPNVRFVTQFYNINWGGINHLKGILLLVGEALKYDDIEYLHLITGHDFPVKSIDYFHSFMKQNKGKEFMEVNALPYDRWPGNGGLDRLMLYNLYDVMDGRSGWRRRIVDGLLKMQSRLGVKRHLPQNFPSQLYGGSTYWTLSRKCLEYVLDYMAKNPGYLKRFEYSFCSEEIFFQTLICNSPFKDNVVNNNLRFILWEERNGNFPANLDDSDYDAIMRSDALFARKFEYPVSQSLLDKIEKLIGNLPFIL